MHSIHSKKAGMVQFAFLIYMLILGVVFGLFLFKGYSFVVDSQNVVLERHLQIATIMASSAFSIDGSPIYIDASIKLQDDVTSVGLKGSSLLAYVDNSPFLRSIKTYPTSIISENTQENTNTVRLRSYDNTLYVGDDYVKCDLYDPDMYVIVRDETDQKFINFAKSIEITLTPKTEEDSFDIVEALVFDLDESNSGLTIYTNVESAKLCGLKLALQENNIRFTILPADDFSKMRYPQITDKLIYVTGGENLAKLITTLKEVVA